MANAYRRRRIVAALVFVIFFALTIFKNASDYANNAPVVSENHFENSSGQLAIDALESLLIKNRAPSDNYDRAEFGDGWEEENGCDTRNIILNRDLSDVKVDDDCHVVSGVLNDPYTGGVISFVRGDATSDLVQIDHVVALSDAWRKGAQDLSFEERIALANDPLELLAVDGEANQDKSDSDASDWLPPNKAFRCQYVARQVAVKQKYELWVTQAEHDAIDDVLDTCKTQVLPSE